MSSSAQANSYYAHDGSRNLAVVLNYLPIILPQPKHLKAIFFHLSNIQLISILISIQMRILSPSRTDAVYPYYVGEIAEILTLQNYFENNYQAWIYAFAVVAVWIYILILTTIFALLGIRAITRKQLIPTPNLILDIVFQFHLSIMFWIANMVLLTPWADEPKDKKSAVGLTSDDTTFMGLNWTAFILNYFIGVLLALFAKEPFKGREEYASHSSSHQFILFLSKAAIAPLIVFLKNSAVGIAGYIVIVGLALALFMGLNLVKTVPFYSPSTMKSSLIWNHIAIWIAFVNCLVVTFFRNIADYNIVGLAYMETIFVPLFIKLAFTNFSYIVRKFIARGITDLKTEKQVFAKLMSFTEMTKNMKLALNQEITSNIYEAYFMGDVTEHATKCENDSCVCHVLLKEDFPRHLEEMRNIKHGIETYFEDRVLEITSQSIDRLRNCNNLRVILANLILDSHNVRLSVALNYLYSITQDHSNISVNIKRNILLKKIQDSLTKHFSTKEKNVLDIKAYIDFQTDKSTFMNLLLLITKKYQDFWNCYRQPNFAMKELYERSIEIEQKADKLDSYWNSFVNKYPRFYQAIGETYCNYQRVVRNSPFLATKTVKKYSWKLAALLAAESKKSSAEISEDNIYLNDTVTFYVSMSRERTGRIQYASSSAVQVLGYTNEELMGKNINVLMSPLIAKDHEHLLNRHRDISKMLHSKNHYNISAYVRNKCGYYAPCTTYITIFPYIQKELTYIGVLRTYNLGYEHIIVTESGQIDGFTEKIGEELNLPVDKPFYLSEICPDMVKAPNTPGNKHRTFAKVVLDAMSEDFLEKGDCSSFRRTSVKQMSKTLKESQLRGGHDDNEEAKWKSINFIEYGSFNTYGEHTPKFTYDIRVVQKTLIQKTFHIIHIKHTIVEQDFQNESPTIPAKRLSSEKKEIENPLSTPTTSPQLKPEDDLSENDEVSYHIPPERSRIMDDRFTSLGILYSPANRSEVALLSAKNPTTTTVNTNMNFIKTTIADPLPTEAMMSPKIPQELNFSSFMQFESDVNTTTKRGDVKRKTVKINQDVDLPGSVEVEMNEKGKESWRQMRRPFNRDPDPDQKPLKLSDRASSSLTSATSKPKIEEAVYMIPPNSVSKRIGFLTILSFIICTVLFVVYSLHRAHTVDLMKGNVQIINLSSARLNQIVLALRVTQSVYYLEVGLMPDDSLSVIAGLPSLGSALPAFLKGLFDDLREMNNEVRIAINATETSTQLGIFSNLVPMQSSTDSTIYYQNIFDAVTQISNQGLGLARTPSAMFAGPLYQDMVPLLLNPGGVLLVYSEEINNILVQDSEYKLNYDKRLLIIFLITVIALAVVNITLLGFKQLEFIKDRNRFIELLLHLDEKQIDREMEKVKIFEASLFSKDSKHELTKRKNSYHSARMEHSAKRKESAKTSRLRKRDTNLHRLNVNQWIVFALSVILFIIFVIPFIHLLVRISVKNTSIVTKISNLIEVNTTLYELLLLFVAFNEYLAIGSSGPFRDQTVGEQWDILYSNRANSQGYFLKLLISMQDDQSCDTSVVDELTTLINGNLCTTIPARFSAICPSLCDGAIERGIQGLNSYMISTLQALKADYDDSSKTPADVTEVLSRKEFAEIQIIVSQWQYPAFAQITAIIEKCTLEMLENLNIYFAKMMGIYIPIWVVAAFIVSRYFMKNFEKERVEWRKVFRKIPLEIIVTSKILKFHLAKHSELVIKN